MKDYTQDLSAVQNQPVSNQNSASLARIVILADLLVTFFLVTGMVVDKHSVTISVLSGVTFFASFGGLAILVISGALPAMVINGQNNKTERYLYSLQYKSQSELSRLRILDPMQLPYADPVQTPMQLPENTTFVQPHADVEDSIKREALLWLASLYDSSGQPDSKRVIMKSDKERPGRVRVAAPSRQAKQYLLDKHILLDLGGTGFRLNLVRCPSIEMAQQQLM